jgi:polyadenylate-binding protein
MSNPTTPYASASLYVGDLAPEVTEALLFERFNAVGPVASVRVCRDAATRRSLGYAYVNFHRVDDAERALDTMNFINIRGQPCRIMWSHRDPSLRKSGVGNIFVKNLAKSIDNKSLYDTFSMFGNILSCKVACNVKSDSLGYGFVHYESEEAAKDAIMRVDGKVIAGHKVSVSPFKSKKDRGINKNRYTNLYVKHFPLTWNQDLMEDFFGKYGTITSSFLPIDEAKNQPKGFGFVNYNTFEEAKNVVETLHGYQIAPDKNLYVQRAMRKGEREKALREHFEKIKQERQKHYTGINLYIKNLGDAYDDNRLRGEFAQFGNITSCKVMRDQKGKSKGFGFVCFTTPEEATKAVTEMNGRMSGGKPLYVALAQRKEVRRAQLEAQYAARAKMGIPIPQPQIYPHPQGVPMQYYQGMPPRNFMYPQQMVRPQWAQAGGHPAAAMMRPGGHPGINYHLMPAMPQPQRAPPRGGVQRRRNMPNAPKPVHMHPQTRNFEYAERVRNPQRMNQQQVPQPTMVQQVQRPPDVVGVPFPGGETQTSLTIKALAAAPEEQKKQMIGEHIFPLIKKVKPQLAGKITGMLLEMDNGELLHLIESEEALHEKIEEAMQVLREHEAQQGQVQ